MICYNGIPLQSGFTVPCGQCISCRINKGRKWTSRLLLEWIYADRPENICHWFLTLTYDDEHVPRTDSGELTLEKKQAFKWVAAMQRKHGSFRYFVVGEYGDRTWRPHLHMGLFSVPYRKLTAILDDWSYGHKRVSPMDRQRAQYLCHYTAKKLSCPKDERLKEDMEPEFRASTRVPAIGAPALPSLIRPYRSGNGKKLVEERGDVERTVRISGKIYPLDGYILGKMRKELGIPRTHTERMDWNPNYYLWHESQEALCDPVIHANLEMKYAKKKELRQSITQTI